MNAGIARQQIGSRNLRIQARISTGRKRGPGAETHRERRYIGHLINLFARADIKEQTALVSDMVVEINALVIPPQREIAETVVSHVRVLHFLAIENEAARKGPPGRHFERFARVRIAANIFIEAISKRAAIRAVTQKEAGSDVLPETVGHVPLIVKAIGGYVVLLAADEIESGVKAQ